MLPEVTPLEGVFGLITEMSENYRLAVASSSDIIELEEILSVLGVRHFFEVVVGGDMVEAKKPNPGVYLKALELLDLNAHDCLAFEDSQSGVAAAKAAGLSVVAIPSKLSMNHDFSQADLIVDSFEQFNSTNLACLQ
jgi:beta-phosphoglucomutase-like phosphatase (HAD superfamily)